MPLPPRERFLFCNQKEIIFLPPLHNQVFVVYEVVYMEHSCGIVDLMLVYRHAAALDHFSCFALGGEYSAFNRQQVQDGYTRIERSPRDAELWYAVKHIQHGGIRQAMKELERPISEQEVGRFYCRFIIRFRMGTDRNISG